MRDLKIVKLSDELGQYFIFLSLSAAALTKTMTFIDLLTPRLCVSSLRNGLSSPRNVA
jgi:hypothetical protein